ncbi:VOC family protein [Edaphobacter sp. HDX4]|uniref:VOC family protein n=1 Tax=Edaphobacter sp. HDX4 TaxID=2794064 RepID=UPI002FE690FA
MLPLNDPIAFIPIIDANRSRQFYVEILGLNFLSDDGFALVLRSGAIDVRLVRMGSFSPTPYTIFGWKVPDIDIAVRELSQLGISFEKYPFLEQDVSGIWSAPGGAAQVAWFKDPDGNILSISQHLQS